MTEQDIKKIAEAVIATLSKKNKLITENDPIKKAEKLLNYYSTFKKKLEEKQEALDNIILYKSSGIASSGSSSNNFEYKSDLEKIEEKKEQLLGVYEKYQQVVDMVESALHEIENDKYYDIIELHYIDKYSYEDVAEELDVEVSVVYRNRKRLITELSIHLFPEQLFS